MKEVLARRIMPAVEASTNRPAAPQNLRFLGGPSAVPLCADYYRAPEEKAQLAVVSGLRGHAGWFNSGDFFAQRGISTLAYDRRGAGRSGGLRGHAAQAQDFLDDLRAAVNLLQSRRDLSRSTPPVHLLGHSFGARTVLAALSTRSVNMSSMILLAPGLYIKKHLEFTPLDKLKILGARLSGRTRQSYFRVKSDSQVLAAGALTRHRLDTDPYRLDYVNAAFLCAARKLTEEALRVTQLPGPRPPLLLILGGQDQVVQKEKTVQEFYARYAGPKTLLWLKDSGHLPELETAPAPLKAFREFLGQWMLRPTLRLASDARITI